MKEELDARNTTAVVIGGGTALAARLATRWLKLPYPILHDPEREVYRAYAFERKLGFYQECGTVVVNADGEVVFERHSVNPQRALPRSKMLSFLEEA